MVELTWQTHPQNRHITVAYIVVRNNLRYKLGCIINEHRNAMRPKGCNPPAKAYGIELYFPLTQGQDKVQKFETEREALDQFIRLLDAFTSALTGEPT